MKLPIDGIQAFVQIAELGSFSRAAEKLFLTQTALTRRIQRLESFVEVLLLDRTTRSTSLTAAGRDFLPLATRLVNDLTFGLERLRTTSRLALGEVTVATLQSAALNQLPFALRKYASKFPQNRVHVLERSGVLVTEAVRQAEADFGIHIQQDGQGDLSEELLVRDPFVLVCGRRHPLAKTEHVRWADLHGTDLITLGGASGNRLIVEAQMARTGLQTRGRFVVESTPTATALAAAGVGVAILPAITRPAATATGLVQVPLVEPVVFRSLGLIKRRNESLTPAAAELYSLVKREFSISQATL